MNAKPLTASWLSYYAVLRMNRADRNDANEMVSLEGMRADGLTPARRVEICADQLEPLGATNWNARSDARSAAPDDGDDEGCGGDAVLDRGVS
jgi:hypothetical protein